MAKQTEVHNPFEGIYSKLDHFERLLTEHTKKEAAPKTDKPTDEAFITKEKVSELYGISHVTVWDWEKKGILQSYRIGNLKRFKLSEVMAAPVPIKRATRSK